MAKPLNHNSKYMALIADQLRAQFPSASGAIIRETARLAASDVLSARRVMELTARCVKLIEGEPL